MKRFLIFALLYPLMVIIGLALFSLAVIGVLAMPNKSIILTLLVWCYVSGLVPAVVLAFMDWFLAARLRVLPRIVSTAVAGYVLALLAVVAVYDRSIWVETLIFGLVGAIPAAVCTWLADERKSAAAPR